MYFFFFFNFDIQTSQMSLTAYPPDKFTNFGHRIHLTPKSLPELNLQVTIVCKIVLELIKYYFSE